MKKYILAVVLLVCFAVAAFAARPELERDGAGAKLTPFAPNAKKQRALTVNRSAVNMSDDLQYMVFNAQSSCKFRNQSTVTSTGSLRYLPKGSNYTRGVNSATPFINLSACTNGMLERQ